jgi:hypothetical protein
VEPAALAPKIVEILRKMACFGGVRDLPVVMAMPNPELKQVSVSSVEAARPVQDEWGFYDPEQAGLEAVMRRLMATCDENSDAAATSASANAPLR